MPEDSHKARSRDSIPSLSNRNHNVQSLSFLRKPMFGQPIPRSRCISYDSNGRPSLSSCGTVLNKICSEELAKTCGFFTFDLGAILASATERVHRWVEAGQSVIIELGLGSTRLSACLQRTKPFVSESIVYEISAPAVDLWAHSDNTRLGKGSVRWLAQHNATYIPSPSSFATPKWQKRQRGNRGHQLGYFTRANINWITLDLESLASARNAAVKTPPARGVIVCSSS
jgi:hypothetical protein